MGNVVNVGPGKTRGENSGGLRWGIERRLQFIEFRLFWEGGVNRADIIEAFDVSIPQASKDLSLYQERAPDNAVYDKHAKRYVAGKNFEPHFLQPDPDGYLSRLRSIADGLITPAGAWIAEPLPVEVTLSPRREISPKILRVMLSTVRAGKSVELLYQSMSTRQPEPIWRKISPHAFGFDGLRWHVRAFCHLDSIFKDFLLPRMIETAAITSTEVSCRDDELWNNSFSVIIIPHPGLGPSQRKVVSMDYGMDSGRSTLKIRYAMLFYVLKRLGLLGEASQEDPRRQHIVVENFDETKAALLRAGFPG